MMILENDILSLVPFMNVKDNTELKKEYLSWLNNKSVITSINSYELLKHKDISFVEESFKRFTSKNCSGYFIFVKEDNKYIGTVKLDKIDMFRRSAEIGIMIGDTSYYGKGFGYESVKLLVTYSFETLKLHRIWGGTDEYNISMRKIFKKLNFTQEGVLREANYINENYSDNVLYSILSNEYN